jgi:hypothetical protein
MRLPTVNAIEQSVRLRVKRKSDFAEYHLEALRKDMQDIVLPSHVQMPPRNFGSPSHGKLKADNWKVLCTIIIPVTFIQLLTARNEGPRMQSLLQHFMLLSNATHIASQRIQTEESIRRFKNSISDYVKGVPDLFESEHALVPNHHMALHLAECFYNFGPVHSWWAYPSERLNGLLQNMNTNYIASEPLTYN